MPRKATEHLDYVEISRGCLELQRATKALEVSISLHRKAYILVEEFFVLSQSRIT